MSQRIAILGAAESGTGAAILAAARGWDVLVSDGGRIPPPFRAKLDALSQEAGSSLRIEEGTHTEADILKADIVVKSPGIPHKAPIVQAIQRRGIPVLSEIEFASIYTHSKIIAITGTNGKTTTTSLIYSMLKNAGFDVGLGGNIGYSFAELVARHPHSWYVLEVSSFQLDDVHHFRPHIAVLTNITDNHLDRYNYDISLYARAKFNITRNMGSQDHFIYSLDSEVLMREMPKYDIRAQKLGFSLTQQPGAVAWVDNNSIVVDMNKERKKKKSSLQIPAEKQKLRGKHNQYNTMASAIVGNVLQIRSEVVRESMLNFENIEHRLERVRNVNGIDYINDSKATSVNAAWYALESMQQPVLWIVGGVDKGNDYGMLLPIVEERVKAIVMLGPEVAKIEQAFKGKVPTLLHAPASMEEAVRMATQHAATGDAVLLSPACASFDLFKNYEERGQKFKEAVEKLD